jgi:hypothetical protein
VVLLLTHKKGKYRFKRMSRRIAGVAILDSMNRILTGPYTVTVDGNATRNFETVSDEASNENNSIKVYFSNGTYKISI